MSADVKARYANQYQLKGVFMHSVESDDFIGLFGNEKFGLLSAINKALEIGDGLTENEIHGDAIENYDCGPDYPSCRPRLHPTSRPVSEIFLK